MKHKLYLMTNEIRPYYTSTNRQQMIRNTNNSHFSHRKKQKQKIWTRGSLAKISLETCLTKENFNGYLGELISNKSVKYTTFNNRKCLCLPKYSTNHDDSNNNDDSISHDGAISHDVCTCYIKKDFNSYRVKCIKKL